MAAYTRDELEHVFQTSIKDFWSVQANVWYVRNHPSHPWTRTTVFDARDNVEDLLQTHFPGERKPYNLLVAYRWMRGRVQQEQSVP